MKWIDGYFVAKLGKEHYWFSSTENEIYIKWSNLTIDQTIHGLIQRSAGMHVCKANLLLNISK